MLSSPFKERNKVKKFENSDLNRFYTVAQQKWLAEWGGQDQEVGDPHPKVHGLGTWSPILSSICLLEQELS